MNGIVSCDADNHQNCRIYKVTVDPLTWAATAELVEDWTAEGFGLIQPAVDFTGRWLAAAVSSGWNAEAGNPDEVGLVAWTPHGDRTLVGLQKQGAMRPQMPAWTEDRHLVWEANSHSHAKGAPQWWGNLHEARISASMTVSSIDRGGPDGSDVDDGTAPCKVWPSDDCVSWRDPDVYHDPPGHASGDWVTVFGKHGAPGTDEDSKPVVAWLTGRDTIEEFDLGTGRDGEDIVSCHHSAWNFSGTEILCMRQFDPDKKTIFPAEVRALYAYRYNASTGSWSGAREVVDSSRRHGQGSAQSADIPEHALWTYKFGHWCGSDRYVVATLFAQESDGTPVLDSRVLLFDTEGFQVSIDLTSVIEHMEGQPFGAYRGIFSACKPPSPGRFAA